MVSGMSDPGKVVRPKFALKEDITG
jgi:hypothetical protein